MASGSALPGWLSFDGTSFSGTPGLSDAGEYVIEVTATDDAGATADTSFRLMVEDAPVPNLLLGTRHKDVLKGTAGDECSWGLAATTTCVAAWATTSMCTAAATAMTRSSKPAATSI